MSAYFVRPAVAAISLSFVAGCMGGEPGFTSRVVTGPDALNIGTTSTTASSSGIPFSGGEDLGALDGNRYTLIGRLVRFLVDWETGEESIVVTDEQLRLSFVEGEDFVQSITFNGRTYDFNSSGESPLPNGQILNVSSYDSSTCVGVLNVDSYSASLSSGFDTDGFIVLGLQTNPNDIPDGGLTTYEGGIEGYGDLFDGYGDLVDDAMLFEGIATIGINFGNNAVTDTNVELQMGDFAIYQTLFFDGNGGLISGNGFADTLSISSCPSGSVGCDGTVLIGGAFFGPNGEELAGNIAVDYTVQASDPFFSDRFIGAGYFVATEVPVP